MTLVDNCNAIMEDMSKNEWWLMSCEGFFKSHEATMKQPGNRPAGASASTLVREFNYSITKSCDLHEMSH